MTYTHRSTCRLCKKTDLVRFLSLGLQPPADEFVDADGVANEQKYPLDLYFCSSCSLVQLLDVVPQEELFHEGYANVSSASAPLVEHFKRFAHDVAPRYLNTGDFVVDIGSNDGVLLQFFTEQRVLGIDPAVKIAEAAREKGIEMWTEFFTEALALKIKSQKGQPKLITANNVFAHIDDMDDAMRGVKTLLAEDGTFIFEAHYLLDLVEHCEFDTVCHEHLCYYTLRPLIPYFESFGMVIVDVERISNHGGSIRVFAAHAPATANARVSELLAIESSAGVHGIERFSRFQKDVEAVRERLVSMVRGYAADGKKVVGYGAPAKSGTLLNYCGFTAHDIAYITDTTPRKVGRLTPGTHIPVVAPDILKNETPDYVLLLAWNYRDFILKKEQGLRDRGARFIIPIPYPEVV